MTSNGKDDPGSKHKGDEKVKLVSSALFVATHRELPRNIAARDLEGLVAGWVEEASPLPLHQMSWGFIFEMSRKAGGRVFFYAAPRDLVFAGQSGKSNKSNTPHYPSFCALQGLRFKKDTWVTLLDDDCVAALHFPAGSTIPERMESRFLQHPEQEEAPVDPWRAREELLFSISGGEPDSIVVEPGFVRATAKLQGQKMRVQFHLEAQLRPESEWSHWKNLEFRKPLEILSADVRNREDLLARAEGTKSSQRVVYLLAGLAACIALLLIAEGFLLKTSWEVRDLDATIQSRQATVSQLEEIESMTKAINTVLRKDFDPLEWLVVINESRPQEVYFTSFSHEGERQLRMAGQSREISFINQFADKLRADPRVETVTVTDVRTAQVGATFSLTVDTGNIRAEKPAEEPAAEAAEEESA